MKSIFPFGIRKDMSVIEWNRETCDFRIRKGRYILQKTQILQKSYRSEEVAFYMVKIFNSSRF